MKELAWKPRKCCPTSLWDPLNIPDFTVLAPLSLTLGFFSSPSDLILEHSSSSTCPDPDTLGDPRDLCLTFCSFSSSSSVSFLASSLAVVAIPPACISLSVLMVGGVLKWNLSPMLESSVDSQPCVPEGAVSSIAALSSFPIPEKRKSILYWCFP